MVQPDAPVIAGRFQLERKLGSGAFGEVHLARDTTNEKKVVIKFILQDYAKDDELRERFRREIRALELVKHPCVPALVSSGEDGQGRLFYAVEFADGLDLNKAMIEKPGPWPFERALAIMDDLLAALGAAHEKGVIHRDVKPANVILVQEGGRERARLIDFGIAKHFEAGEKTMQDMTQGRAIGTPYYLSPEQAEGEVVDARTDLYASAVLFYEVLTGLRPFRGTTTNEILRAILKQPPPPLREKRADAPPALEQLLLRMLAKNRDQRPGSAAEAGKLLHAAFLAPRPGEPDGSALTGILVPKADTWTGRTIAGKYELKGKLGKGGFGSVYKAWHKELKIDVAIKLIQVGEDQNLDEIHERFRREARAMRSFVHKHAVQVRDFGRDGATFYLELDYLEGETLEALLAREKRLEEPRVLELAGQILSALAEAHAHGIIHRDLKPANIFITQEGGKPSARILDFGIVKLLGALEDTTRGRTGPGVAIGTAHYMSPEQAGGDPVTKASDVWSMGVLLYLSLSGAFPIDAGSEPSQASLRARIMTKPPRPLAEVAPQASARTRDAIMHALEKTPTSRPADARAFAQELLAGTAYFLEVGAQTYRGPETLLEPSPVKGKARKPWGAIAGLVLLAGGVVALSQPSVRDALLAKKTPVTPPTPPPTPSPPPTPPVTPPPPPVTPPPPPVTSPPPPPPVTPPPPPTVDIPKTPTWWQDVPEARRPKLPLPSGLDFGKAPGTYVNAKDGSVLSFVPAGEYPMGSSRQSWAEPEHRVSLLGFYLGLLEVTWEQFGKFDSDHVKARPSWAGKDHPVLLVRWGEAKAYCDWAGLRLPTEAEWEAAARGTEGRTFPWGEDEPTKLRLNADGAADGFEHTAPVGSFPKGASPFGCLDMAGNVAEWCSDWFGPYSAEKTKDPQGPDKGTERVVRGGSWTASAESCRAAQRTKIAPDTAKNFVGFRVARSAD